MKFRLNWVAGQKGFSDVASKLSEIKVGKLFLSKQIDSYQLSFNNPLAVIVHPPRWFAPTVIIVRQLSSVLLFGAFNWQWCCFNENRAVDFFRAQLTHITPLAVHFNLALYSFYSEREKWQMDEREVAIMPSSPIEWIAVTREPNLNNWNSF